MRCPGKILIAWLFVWLLVQVLFSGPLFASGAEGERAKLFFTANKLYQQGEYAEARNIYKGLTETIPSGQLYFNMGNCLYKLNQIGAAIVNYKRALRLDPRNSGFRANLSAARQEAKDHIEDKRGFMALETLFFWYDDLSFKEILFASALFYSAMMSLLTLGLFRRSHLFGLSLSAAAFLFLLLASSACFKYVNDFVRVEGAVARDEVSVYSANDARSVVLFKLHNGAEFKVLKEKGDWIEIRLKDNKNGWVVRELTELI